MQKAKLQIQKQNKVTNQLLIIMQILNYILSILDSPSSRFDKFPRSHHHTITTIPNTNHLIAPFGFLSVQIIPPYITADKAPQQLHCDSDWPDFTFMSVLLMKEEDMLNCGVEWSGEYAAPCSIKINYNQWKSINVCIHCILEIAVWYA